MKKYIKDSRRLFYKKFTTSDIIKVQEFVVKKLGVNNIFMVRDRFEGNQYLRNTITKYQIFYTLVEYFSIEIKRELKLGFISTIAFEKLLGVEVKIFNSSEDLYKYELEDSAIYFLVNVDGKTCEIYSSGKNHESIKNKFLSQIVGFKDIFYVSA